jgi:hypothetical protein
MNIEEWLQKYSKLDVRFETMKQALELAPKSPNIVETGCVRLEDDWGGGMSTVIFSDFVTEFGGQMTTVDLSEDNIKLCAKLCEQFKDVLKLAVSDSVDFLKSLPADTKIDLLYLDSFDYPYGELLNEYGGREDIQKAIDIVKGMSDDEIVERHIDIIDASQQHCLNEIKAALPFLHDQTPILIDDGDLPGGGKPRLAKLFLAENGYTCVVDSYQTLWVKEITK